MMQIRRRVTFWLAWEVVTIRHLDLKVGYVCFWVSFMILCFNAEDHVNEKLKLELEANLAEVHVSGRPRQHDKKNQDAHFHASRQKFLATKAAYC